MRIEPRRIRTGLHWGGSNGGEKQKTKRSRRLPGKRGAVKGGEKHGEHLSAISPDPDAE